MLHPSYSVHIYYYVQPINLKKAMYSIGGILHRIEVLGHGVLMISYGYRLRFAIILKQLVIGQFWIMLTTRL